MILLFLGICLSISGPAQSTAAYYQELASLYSHTVPVIRADSLMALMEADSNVVILDTRSPEEFEVSRLPGATFVNYDKFRKTSVENLPENTPIVTYCTVGYRSEKIGEKLLKMGYSPVYNLYGGIFEWVNRGYQVYDARDSVTTKVHTYDRSWSKWLVKGQKIY